MADLPRINELMPTPNLGACCVCGHTIGVTNILMLDRLAPVPGTGWGCLVCGLPSDGAVAVVCDPCLGQTPRFVCAGYPADGERAPYEDLPPDEFKHNEAAHAADQGSMQ